MPVTLLHLAASPLFCKLNSLVPFLAISMFCPFFDLASQKETEFSLEGTARGIGKLATWQFSLWDEDVEKGWERQREREPWQVA